MKKLALLMLLVGTVAVFTGCEKTDEEKRNEAVEQFKKDAKEAGEKAGEAAEDAGKAIKEGTSNLLK